MVIEEVREAVQQPCRDVGRVEEVLIHAKASLSLKRRCNRQDTAKQAIASLHISTSQSLFGRHCAAEGSDWGDRGDGWLLGGRSRSSQGSLDGAARHRSCLPASS